MHHVLLIEDDKDLREMVTFIITNSGMTIDSESDGKNFLFNVKQSEPDILLMDIYLGEEDGRDLCIQLKSDPVFAELPVILYSAGNISPESILKSKADLFIPKPFNINKLIENIKQLVQCEK